jgi:hypothetical protein
MNQKCHYYVSKSLVVGPILSWMNLPHILNNYSWIFLAPKQFLEYYLKLGDGRNFKCLFRSLFTSVQSFSII